MSPHLTQRHSSGASPSDHRTRRPPSPPSYTLPDLRAVSRNTVNNTSRDGHGDRDLHAGRSHFSSRSYQNPMKNDPAWRNYVRQRAASQTVGSEYDGLTARRLMLQRRDQQLSAGQNTPLSFPDARRLVTRPTPENTFDTQRPSLALETGPRQPTDTPNTDGLRTTFPEILSNRKRSRGAIELPKWQPDEEITECPICGTTFTFWYRKHHCRKCGRVVCASCSPHRITIPRQFIVHPPEMPSAHAGTSNGSAHEIIDLTGDDESEISPKPGSSRRLSRHNSGVDGGEEVRLCNPCVPDPNPLPHNPQLPTYMGPTLDQISHSSHSRDGIDNDAAPTWSRGNIPSTTSSTAIPHTPVRRGRTQGSIFGSSFPFAQATENMHDRVRQPHQHINPTQSVDLRQRSMMRPTDQHRFDISSDYHREFHPHHRHHASVGHAPSPSRAFQGLDFLFSENEASPHQPLSHPRPQLREEDECPVCHLALPPKGPDGSEVAREAHITACIDTHFSGSISSGSRSTDPVPTTTSSSHTTNPMPGTSNALDSGSASVPARSMPGSSVQRRQTTGMVVYNATEKDCVGVDGETEAECVICFEEFTVGEEMGRLECLCKFHHKCIRQWWSTKGPGVCPVHQQST